MQPLLLLAAAVWIAPTDPRFEVNGLPWLAENQWELIRLPARAKDSIPPAVWNLGLSPSGGRIRFRTGSTRVAIRLEYPSAPNMANMHAFGQTGVDLYIDGLYRSTAIAPKDAAAGKTVEHVFFENVPKQEREITIYLPLYKPVKVLGISLDDGASIAKARRFAQPKPVVYYGTSITQGGCASRSGLSYQAILGRQLNLDFVNLGFSGNGKGEPVVANLVAEIDASAFVLDFAQNNQRVESLREVYEPFLSAIRTKHPATPILAITPIATSSGPERFEDMRQHIRAVVAKKIAEGDKLLTLVEGFTLLGPTQVEGLVDGVHPNDLGFESMAAGLAPHVALALKLPPPRLVDDRVITVRTPGAAEIKRRQIVDFIWGATGFPSAKLPAATTRKASSPISTLRNSAGVETFAIRMDAGEENTTHLFSPRKANGELMVLQHGHACTFDDAADPKGGGMAEATDMLLGAGYSVLIAYMPHMRPGDCRTISHNDMFDRSPHSLRYFLEPVAISLNAIAPRFKRVHMAGLSGGGWTTTLYAAIDPRIRHSFPVAGTIPLYLRVGGSVGDKEQYLEEFYRLAGYPDLYVVGAMGAGRKQVQILNRKDNCCFGEAQHDAARIGLPYEDAYRIYERAVRETGVQFRLVIDETAPRHMISPAAVKIMLDELRQ
ncbi:MAG: hypothetical protein FJW30_06975 [Acidobacteria bacterium]|nr:hypothetical protein [Acidobacteriota bacterium]